MPSIEFYTAEPLTPTALDVLRSAVRAVYGEEPVTFKPVAVPGSTTLCFGADGGVRTLSVKQMMSGANAVSTLIEALTLHRDGNTLPAARIIDVSPEDAPAYIAEMHRKFMSPVVFDIEHAPDRSLLSIAVTYGGNQIVFTSHFREVTEALATHYFVCAHGGKADQGVLRDAYGIKVPIWFDTMIARHALHPASQGNLSLKIMANRILGIPDWETGIKKFTGTGENADYSKIPHDHLVRYNGMDVYATWHLMAYHLLLVIEEPIYLFEMRATYDMLADVEYSRVRLDTEYTAAFSAELDAAAQEQLAVLRAETKNPKFNPNSPKQVLMALNALGYFPDGTDAKILGAMKSKGQAVEIIEPLLEYRSLTKLRSTYCEGLLRRAVDGLVRAEFNVEGTSSGRLSGRNPNLQNIPRDKRARGMFIAHDPDDVLVEVDYAQAELRAQAILSGDPAMIAAFQPDSPDFFDGLMSHAFPVDFPDLETYLTYEREQCGGDEKNYRAKLKATIYGLNFGRGAAAIAESLKMSTPDAQQIIDGFMQAYPTWAAWRQDVMEAAVNQDKRDMLTAWTGHHFEAEVITARNRAAVQRSALSYLPQSTVGGLCTMAGIRVNQKLKDLYPEAKLVMLIHDALYVNCKRTIAQEVGEMVAWEMEAVGREVFGTAVLFTAEPGYSYRWGEKEK